MQLFCELKELREFEIEASQKFVRKFEHYDTEDRRGDISDGVAPINWVMKDRICIRNINGKLYFVKHETGNGTVLKHLKFEEIVASNQGGN